MVWIRLVVLLGFPCGSDSKEFTCNVGDQGLIPGLGRSVGEGNGYPLQYSCLGNPMDRGAWRGYSPWGHKELDTTEPLTLCGALTGQTRWVNTEHSVLVQPDPPNKEWHLVIYQEGLVGVSSVGYAYLFEAIKQGPWSGHSSSTEPIDREETKRKRDVGN